MEFLGVASAAWQGLDGRLAGAVLKAGVEAALLVAGAVGVSAAPRGGVA